MICIYCFHKKTRVTNSRPHKKQPQTWRRRQCLQCQALFTTYERPASDDLTVHASDTSSTPFNLGKLTISIARAAQHNATQASFDSYFLAQTVELEVIKHATHTSGAASSQSSEARIDTATIAELTHQTLKKFDELTALQYAMQHGLIVSVRRRGRPSTTATKHGDGAERD